MVVIITVKQLNALDDDNDDLKDVCFISCLIVQPVADLARSLDAKLTCLSSSCNWPILLQLNIIICVSLSNCACQFSNYLDGQLTSRGKGSLSIVEADFLSAPCLRVLR